MLNELILGVVGENGTSFLQSCTSAIVVGLPDSRELVLPPLHRRYCVSLGPWLVLAPSPRRRRSFNLDTVLRGGTRHVNAAPAGPAEEIWLNCLQGQNFVSDAFQQLCTCG